MNRLQFIQLKSNPGQGIPHSDGLCFGMLTNRIGMGGYNIYTCREHPKSNKNNGGWAVEGATTGFKLELIF